jgi:hypothetical protein
MRRDDAGSLVFDSPPLERTIALLGQPRVVLDVIMAAPLANWTARLEDVGPDGQAALVTGGVLNATGYRSLTAPERLVPGRTYRLTWDLHFTTWTYQPGHRVRLSLANAQFPMIWPTPYPMISHVLPDSSMLEIPVVPDMSAYPAPRLPLPEARSTRPGVRWLGHGEPVERISYEPLSGSTAMEWATASAWTIDAVRYDYAEREVYRTSDGDPSHASFLGIASHRIRPPGRDFALETTIDIRSDSTAFHVTVIRRLSVRGKLIRQRRWQEAIPREYH